MQLARFFAILALTILLFPGPTIAQAQSSQAQTKQTQSKTATDSAAPTNAAATDGTAATSAKPAAQPAAPNAGTATPSAPDSMDGPTYAVRLRDLEQRIDELKEQIRRSHTKLSLLSDTILGGGMTGSRATIAFDNEMSGAFRLTRAVFVLDGAVQYSRSDDTGALAEQKNIPVYEGSIPPGDHTLQIILELRGHGYGVFSYLRGYKFEVRSSHSFTITDGKTVTLRAVAYEKGGITTPLEQRPAVRYLENVSSIDGTSSSPSEAKPAAKRASEPAGRK